jgi:hypothetical protein
MRFGTRKFRSLYRAGLLKTVATDFAMCNADLVAIKVAKPNNVGSLPTDDYTFFYGSGNVKHHLGTDILVCKGIRSAVERGELISDRMSYIMLRGCWCDIFVLNVHAPTEDESDDIKDSFHEEIEHVFDHFPKYPREFF